LLPLPVFPPLPDPAEVLGLLIPVLATLSVGLEEETSVTSGAPGGSCGKLAADDDSFRTDAFSPAIRRGRLFSEEAVVLVSFEWECPVLLWVVVKKEVKPSDESCWVNE
jgi:hypothetical protein